MGDKITRKRNNKIKVGTILDTNIVERIKERSIAEGRTISDIIEDALLKYENKEPVKLELRKEALKRFCSKPFNLTNNEIDEILNEDYYEQ